MMDNFKRKSSKPMSAMLIPSICIEPDVKSTSLNNATPNDDLPEPVRPTMPKYTSKLIINESATRMGNLINGKIPIFSLGLMSNETLLRTSGKLDR